METTELTIIQLPEEVQTIALKVSEEKREEVNLTLQNVFSGTADWKAQVDGIVITSPTDKMGMNLAKTARINAKNARLAAEKIFDQKRNEVQAQMLSYQTEDKLWLKAKQTMQILFKEIETAAEYKEKTAERYEMEQNELKIQTRLTRLASVNPEITRQEVEAMSDASFDVFLGGLVKAKDDAEKEAAAELERQEAARKRKEQDEQRFIALSGTGMVYDRFNESFQYGSMCYNCSEFYEMEDAKFEKAVSQIALNISELKAAEEKERVRLAELARKQQEELDAERKRAEAERRKAEEKLEKERAEAKRIQDEKDAENARLQAELKAKADKEAAELKAKQEAEKQAIQAAKLAAKAPRKERLMAWVDGFSIPEFADDVVASDIIAKFEAFKNWAKGQVEKDLR